jgi:hypothetical protein
VELFQAKFVSLGKAKQALEEEGAAKLAELERQVADQVAAAGEVQSAAERQTSDKMAQAEHQKAATQVNIICYLR